MQNNNEFLKFRRKLVRSERKTIAIHIRDDGTVVVKMPYSASIEDVEEFLQRKREWVITNSEKRRQAWAKRENSCLSFGDSVVLLGKERTLTPQIDNLIRYDDDAIYLPRKYIDPQIRNGIEMLYKRVAAKIISEKVFEYAKLMSVEPLAVKINSAKTIWGSCSGKNSLNFTWRLVFADSAIIDYVVVHELAHIRQHNHSKEFWDLVAEYCPNHQECKDGLENLHQQLIEQAWI